MNNHISVKEIVALVEEYYSGKQIDQICDEYEIEQEVFESWLAEYKHLAIQIIELKLENENLRRMFVDLSLQHYPLDHSNDQDITN